MKHGISRQYLHIWRYQELVKNLVLKELKTTYCASFLGLIWTMVIPASMILIYFFAFRYILQVHESNFLLLLMTGIIPFSYTSSALMMSTASVISNADLIKKINFPRVILPMTTVLYQFFIFGMAVVIFIPISYLLGAKFGAYTLTFPLILFLHFLTVFGFSCFLSALTVFYRDIKQLIEIIMLFLMWTSAAVYDFDRVPDNIRAYLFLNPFTSFIVSYRDIVYDGRWPSASHLAICTIWAGVSLLLGLSVFRYYDPRFGEEV